MDLHHEVHLAASEPLGEHLCLNITVISSYGEHPALAMVEGSAHLSATVLSTTTTLNTDDVPDFDVALYCIS